MKALRTMSVVGAVGLAALVGCGDDTGAGGGATGGGSAESGVIAVQISGEELGTAGFLFPDGSEVVIADGWELTFDHVFVTIGSVSLADNPDKDPSNQSAMGDIVAEATGPWAIDLAKEGTVAGAGGEGTATPLVKFENQDKNGGAPFDPAVRYAFSYETVAASAAATMVNFEGDAVAEAAYEEASAGGCSVLFVGTATFKGADCQVSNDTYDFTAIPDTIQFQLCFQAPTRHLNCQNENNDGEPFADEVFQRGIPIVSNGESLAQITMHLDHLVYSAVDHEPALYFDQFAAAMVGQPDGTVLTLDMLAGIDPTAFVDGAGDALPWRTCDGSTLPSGAQRAFDAESIPVGPGEDPATGFRDYADFAQYVLSSMGHLNGGEGLCYTDRQYPSPQ